MHAGRAICERERAHKQAESCGRFLAKGRQVFVEGRIQSRKYTDRDGVERKVTEIVASNVLFVGEAGR